MTRANSTHEAPRPLGRDDIMRMMVGYQGASVLGAAAELELFDALTGAPRTCDELAEVFHLDHRACRILLDALSGLGLLVKQDEAYSIPAALAPILRSDSPQTLLPAMHHWMNCLRSWSRLAEVVTTGAPAERQPSIRGAEADRAAFVAAMNSLSVPRAEPLIARLWATGHIVPFEHLLDVGGASGTWTIAFLKSMPEARATIFDLPDAIEQARCRIGEDSLAERVALVAGDFYADSLPTGADLAWVSAIIHQHARDDSRALFQKLHTALRPGGRIAIRDVIMDAARTQPAYGALFAVNMLVNTSRGGTFTFDEVREDLEAAGFRDVTLAIAADDMDAVVVARRE